MTAIAAGSANITATCEGKTATASVSVRVGALIGVVAGGTAGLGRPPCIAGLFLPEHSPARRPSRSWAARSQTCLADPTRVSGLVYDIEPAGTSFINPATLSITYPVSGLTSGVPEGVTHINSYVNNAWAIVSPGTDNATTHVTSMTLNTAGDFEVSQSQVWPGMSNYSPGDAAPIPGAAPRTIKVCIGADAPLAFFTLQTGAFNLPPGVNVSSPSVVSVAISSDHQSADFAGWLRVRRA